MDTDFQIQRRVRVCFIVGSKLPVPAIKGGAIETIVQNIIDENEKQKRFDITVITISDAVADELKRDYKFTKFIDIAERVALFGWLYKNGMRILRKIWKVFLPESLWGMKAAKYILENQTEYDVIIEEINPDILYYLSDKINQYKLIFHAHWAGLSPFYKCKTFLHGSISISKFVESDVYTDSCWNRKNGYVLLNCIDLSKFSKKLTLCAIEKMKENNGILKEEFIILYVGRILEIKGVIELIRAAEMLNNEYGNICLILVGSAEFAVSSSTEYEQRVESEIERSNLHVIKTGFVPNTEIYKYQAVSDVQVVPSKWEEPAGLVVLEAQAAGIPVVTTRRGGIPEFLSPKAGIMVDVDENLPEKLKNAIKILRKDSKQREQMSICGREFAKSYNVDVYYEQFSVIMNSIYGKNNQEKQ